MKARTRRTINAKNAQAFITYFRKNGDSEVKELADVIESAMTTLTAENQSFVLTNMANKLRLDQPSLWKKATAFVYDTSIKAVDYGSVQVKREYLTILKSMYPGKTQEYCMEQFLAAHLTAKE
jgi:hypothetical protein